MSIAESYDDLDKAIQDAADEIGRQVQDPLNLKQVHDGQVEDLKRFKAQRRHAVEMRARLDNQIRALDVRIEMSLSAIKTLQTPR